MQAFAASRHGIFCGSGYSLVRLRLAPCIESQDWPSGLASDHLRTDESLREALLFSLFWRQAPSPAHVSEYKLPAKTTAATC
jgi:hypothetical protein